MAQQVIGATVRIHLGLVEHTAVLVVVHKELWTATTPAGIRISAPPEFWTIEEQPKQEGSPK